MASWIKTEEHPHNLDPSAKLVWSINHGRLDAVYSVRAGFVATCNLGALPETFPTEKSAREALAAA